MVVRLSLFLAVSHFRRLRLETVTFTTVLQLTTLRSLASFSYICVGSSTQLPRRKSRTLRWRCFGADQ